MKIPKNEIQGIFEQLHKKCSVDRKVVTLLDMREIDICIKTGRNREKKLVIVFLLIKYRKVDC